jgi:hypothetical protein
MGARVNFIFDDGTESLVVLYSHYGQSTWKDDLLDAIQHAKPRLGDHSYFTRMVISKLIGLDSLMQETGFGIYAINTDLIGETLDETVLIDLTNNVILDDSQNVIPFYSEMLVK